MRKIQPTSITTMTLQELRETWTEAEFETNVERRAKTANPPWIVYHTRMSIGSRAGFPDLTMVRIDERDPSRDLVIFAELKAPNGRVSEAQQEWLDALARVAARSGGALRVFLWRPRDWPEIEQVLG